ncbi:putative Zinc finger, U1-type [Rosa chinensis]|uniref:Putative Zinc finger, U1-type n=1 Tax=Rosa chinensis TaxID=74649 RepID=A0A2P6P297_ROSCH|nr:putative Zinc finger, U1-type [Rosa chinensis]
MAHASNSAVVVGVGRRRFNLEEYAERACERQRQEEEEERAQKLTKSRGPAVQRKPLKSRTYQVYLESRLGQTQVLTPTAPLSQQAGYLCSDCNCIVKDSANFLDHINGKKHQSSVGMSTKVERATLEQVQSRFEKLKKQKLMGRGC